jgi:ribosomal protein S18 acetylase RimI-like enzyme
MTEKNSIQFRQAVIADAELLVEMGRRTFETAFGPKNDPADMKDYLDKSFSLAQIMSELENKNSIFLLAFQEKSLIGYSKLILNKGHQCVEGPNPVELQRIYVETQAIGHGIGTKILADSLQEARNADQKTIWLGVWEENKKAIRFYERHGFAKMCGQDFMLGSDLQTDWVMQRDL